MKMSLRRLREKYTKKLHAYRVSLMLKKIKAKEISISACCPAAEGFLYANDRICGDPEDRFQESLCKVCLEFVGVTFTNPHSCPCCIFGPEKALVRTKKALKEYYK